MKTTSNPIDKIASENNKGAEIMTSITSKTENNEGAKIMTSITSKTENNEGAEIMTSITSKKGANKMNTNATYAFEVNGAKGVNEYIGKWVKYGKESRLKNFAEAEPGKKEGVIKEVFVRAFFARLNEKLKFKGFESRMVSENNAFYPFNPFDTIIVSRALEFEITGYTRHSLKETTKKINFKTDILKIKVNKVNENSVEFSLELLPIEVNPEILATDSYIVNRIYRIKKSQENKKARKVQNEKNQPKNTEIREYKGLTPEKVKDDYFGCFENYRVEVKKLKKFVEASNVEYWYQNLPNDFMLNKDEEKILTYFFDSLENNGLSKIDGATAVTMRTVYKTIGKIFPIFEKKSIAEKIAVVDTAPNKDIYKCAMMATYTLIARKMHRNINDGTYLYHMTNPYGLMFYYYTSPSGFKYLKSFSPYDLWIAIVEKSKGHKTCFDEDGDNGSEGDDFLQEDTYI